MSAFKVELLDLLAKDFAASGYDLAQPLRTIVKSQAYQREAAAPKPDAATPAASGTPLSDRNSRELLARYPVRPLSADETFLAMAQATGFKGDFSDYEVSALAREDFGYDQATNAFSPQALSVQRGLSLLNSDHVRGACDMAAAATQRCSAQRPARSTSSGCSWRPMAGRRGPRKSRRMLKLAGDEDAAAGPARRRLDAAELGRVQYQSLA